MEGQHSRTIGAAIIRAEILNDRLIDTMREVREAQAKLPTTHQALTHEVIQSLDLVASAIASLLEGAQHAIKHQS